MTVTVTASGKELSQKLTATEMGSGFQYTTEVRVLPQSLQVKISGDITNWNDGGSIGADGNVSFEEFENNFVYDGVSYNIKTMKDGRKWMTDPLRFVPKGKTPSTNPAEPVGIWYPYPTAGVAATDEASIAARGFLYDAATAFGVAEVNSENYKTFEGTQGICPKGWYIPTREDFVALLGNSASTYGDVVEAIWQFGGTGKTFPLAPGADAVVAINGAIDHTLQYPLSVNLNFPECFVCYSPLFPNPIYHPAPGDRIQADHILTLVDKEGQANANLMSINSPTLVLFRAQGKTIQEWVATDGFIRQAPGSTERVFLVPVDWVIDGMEAFDGSSTSNNKRLSAKVDAGYVSLSETFKGHSLHRNIDTEATAEKGFEVLMDTNNSTNDFHERETQSLHK